MAEKPSFFDSLKAGAFGMVKGALMLGIIGVAAGAALGGLLGAASIAPGGAAAVAGTMAAGFGNMGAMIGTIIGGFTGVVMSREAHTVDTQDIVNIANISFAQGVEVGRTKRISHGAAQELQEASHKFQDKLAAESKEQSATLIRH